MRITRFARRTGVSVKAVRYYERIGLITPARSSNGYREFDEDHVRIVEEIRELAAIGIPPSNAGPFIECLNLGHEHGDDCVSSLAVYRDTIADMNRKIASLTFRRDALQQRLDSKASQSFEKDDIKFVDYSILPDGLPVPEDDGAADHLTGKAMPSFDLPSSDGRVINLAELGPGRTILYLYPLTGRPGVDLPEGWDTIPGARGCSTEACNFRNHFQDLRHAGAQRVFGMSSQDTDYQAEVVARLSLPFAMLSDEQFTLAGALRLPVFAAQGHERLYTRLTLVIRDGVIEHVFYPIFPPNTHASQVLEWLNQHPTSEVPQSRSVLTTGYLARD